jgi:dephospho-CoA kinase
MLRIGLTGGIGSGKSAVAAMFTVLNIPVFYADAEAKQVMETDPELVLSIQLEFGTESYTSGKLNRSYISNIVFNDPSRLQKLNALVHPATIRAADAWMKNQTAPYVIKEAALLFEAGTTENLDFIIGVYAPQAQRIKRVMDRDGISRDQVLARMNKQIQETIKMKLCDYVIVNDEQTMVIPQVLQLHETFLNMKR